MAKINTILSAEMRQRLSVVSNYELLRRASNGLALPRGVQAPDAIAIGIYRNFMRYDKELRDLEDRGYATDECVEFTAKGLRGTDFETEAEMVSEKPYNLSMIHDFLSGLHSKRNVRLTRILNRRTRGVTQ